MDTEDIRKQCWRNRFRCVVIPNHLNYPVNEGWSILARLDPPMPAVALPPDPDFDNTGILCDGLQAIDIDLRDPNACFLTAKWCLDNLGDAPIRFRHNAARMLLLYRAAEGEPHKCKAWEPGLNGEQGQGVEVLGHGQQFLAYGTHKSGASIRWVDDQGPHSTPRDALTAITLEQVNELLAYAKGFLNTEAMVSHARPLTLIPPPTYENNARWLDKDIGAALLAIPNIATNYDWWLSVAMAVHAASHGHGFTLFDAWSQQNASYDARLTRKTWNALNKNPPTRITPATLLHYAREANGGFWMKPSKKLAMINPFS